MKGCQLIPDWCKPGKAVVEFRTAPSCRYGKVVAWEPKNDGKPGLYPIIEWRVGRNLFKAFSDISVLEPASFHDRDVFQAKQGQKLELGCRVEIARITGKQPMWRFDPTTADWISGEVIAPFRFGTIFDISDDYAEIVEDVNSQVYGSPYRHDAPPTSETRLLCPIISLRLIRRPYRPRSRSSDKKQPRQRDVISPGQLTLF